MVLLFLEFLLGLGMWLEILARRIYRSGSSQKRVHHLIYMFLGILVFFISHHYRFQEIDTSTEAYVVYDSAKEQEWSLAIDKALGGPSVYAKVSNQHIIVLNSFVIRLPVNNWLVSWLWYMQMQV